MITAGRRVKSKRKRLTTVEKLRVAALFGASLLLLIHIIWPDSTAGYPLEAAVIALYLIAVLTLIDRRRKFTHPQNLVTIIFVVVFVTVIVGFIVWRTGRIVAEAHFNPGIAPFDVTVREVPVPVTNSHHFIITLKRGQYPVTSFRYFWVGYTPQNIRIEWPQLEIFKVIFDDRYVATCHWSWGSKASWSMQVPPDALPPGDQP